MRQGGPVEAASAASAPMTREATSEGSRTGVAPAKVRSNRHRYLGLAGTLCIGIGLSIAAFLVALDEERQRIRAQFDWLATERALSVEHEITAEVDVLGAVAALFWASQSVEQDEFGIFAHAILSRHLGVGTLAWAPCQPNVKQRVGYPLQYIEPPSQKGGALGYDLNESAEWREEMQRALGTAGPVVTRRARLARLSLAPSQFVAMLPVFATGEVRGFLLGVFDARRIAEDALAPFNSSPVGIDVALYDELAGVGGAALFDRPSPLRRTIQLPATTHADPALRHVRTFQAGAQQWTVVCTAAPQFLATHPIREPWIVLVIGCIATGGFVLFVWTLIRRAERVEMEVQQRTGELSRANRQLGQEIVERSRAEEALRRARDGLELRVEERTAELSRLVSELERANQVKSEFVSTMSHELRTPLNVILGFVEMARDPAFGADEQREFFDRIQTAAHELLEMVKSTLDIGKLEAGRDEPDLKPVSLHELWAALQRDCGCLPRADSVSLEWRAGVPEMIFATDPRKLAAAIRNVVGNALKFTERGRVTVSVERDCDGLQFRVQDTGIGIREDDLEAIFEMFRQGDGSDSRAHGGTGLGLYIARRVVEQLGGRITVASQLGHGSVFTIALPVSAGFHGASTGTGFVTA